MYLKTDVLLLPNVFENFRKMCLKISELDPVKSISVSGLAWQAALKNTEVKLELLTDIDMLLRVEKGIRGGTCHTIHRYAKANNKYMKVYDENKESSYLNYWDVNNLSGWAMSQKFPVNNFEWIEETSQFNEEFIENYNEKCDEGYFLEVDVQINYMNFITACHFYQKNGTWKSRKVVTNLYYKNEYVAHIRNSKPTLIYGLILKTVHRVIKFNQKVWL